VTISATTDIWYFCDFVNACGTAIDSLYIDVVETSIVAGNDTTICPGESVQLWASGGVSYIWYPGATLSAVNTSLVTATPTDSTVYYVQGTDVNGCIGYDSVIVNLFPQAFIQTNPDVYAFWGDEVQLWANSTTEGPYIWSPAEFLSCVVCPNPIAIPNQNYAYQVSYTDANGCTSSDSVYIYYYPLIYIPNTFTPNGDGMNQLFLALGGNIRTFEMQIFDRWGELIFTSNDLQIGWDGSYLGKKCQDGTYVWKIRYTDFVGEEHRLVGHVNLLR
jgi:gliding motility-associated-like protein